MFKDENRHYSLRKLSVGLASVLIGISFASGMNSNSVKADTMKGNSNSVQTVVKNGNAIIKIDAKSASTEQSQIPEAVKKDSGAITQDLKKSAVNTKAKQQDAAVQSSDVAGSKALKANNNSIAQEDSSETTLNLKGTKFIDPKTLEENKTEAAIKADPANGVDPVKFASNGGFDPAIWGTMDISKWQLDNNGNIIGYTGDKSHIIIPNSADFTKAGKNYSQISISSGNMGALSSELGDPYGMIPEGEADTLAISLTNNEKVKASNADWQTVFRNSTLKQANLEGLDTSKVTDMSFMFYTAFGLKSLNVSTWDTSNVTNMANMFTMAEDLETLDVPNWNTSKVTDMVSMFAGAKSLTSLDASNWDTSNVTNMGSMFTYDNNLASLDVSNWNTGKVTDMGAMFEDDNSLTSLNVSNWNTDNVTNMDGMFSGASSLALTVNNGKFADYLVKNNFADSVINSDVKSVTTDNAKLLQLLTSDVQHDSSTRTITFTFPANYSPDLAKYHLTKSGNIYQIKQSADYVTSYAQGTVLINETDDITKHHIDTTKKNKLSDTWRPTYDKLVLAHKNSDGTVSFDKVQLPKIPGYKTSVKTAYSPANHANALFAVSFMALPKPVAPAINDTKPAETVSLATPELAKPIKTEPKATAPKVIDLSNDIVATIPDVSTWQVADEPNQNTYHVSNGKYAVELPHISNAQLHVITNDSTKDSILFTYKGQNNKYVFNIKFANGHYLLTTYKIKSGKLIKLIDYNFVKSSKMIDAILGWLKLQ